MSGNHMTKIIFIEDEDIIIDVYKLIMEKVNADRDDIEGLFCSDGQKAIEIINDNPGCIVFCDLCLTGISGESVLKKIDTGLIKKYLS